jgi:hypothetical protein
LRGGDWFVKRTSGGREVWWDGQGIWRPKKEEEKRHLVWVRYASGIKSVEIPAKVLQDSLILKGGIGSLRER